MLVLEENPVFQVDIWTVIIKNFTGGHIFYEQKKQ